MEQLTNVQMWDGDQDDPKQVKYHELATIEILQYVYYDQAHTCTCIPRIE